MNPDFEKEDIYSLYVDEHIKKKAEQFKNEGYTKFERVKVMDVTLEIVAEIQILIGFDATGYQIYSNTDTYKHIEDRHGENGKHDVIIATPDSKYKKLWVMSEYKERKKDTSQPSNDITVLPPTSETHSDNVSSKDIIPQNAENTTSNK